MADTGHAGTQAPQSMHSSGWMKSIGDCSNSGSFLVGWMQSTGHTSTQAVSLVPMQGSVITKVMAAAPSRPGPGRGRTLHEKHRSGLGLGLAGHRIRRAPGLLRVPEIAVTDRPQV